MAYTDFGTVWYAIPNADTKFGYERSPDGYHRAIIASRKSYNKQLIRVLPGTSNPKRKNRENSLMLPNGYPWQPGDDGYFLYKVQIRLRREKFDNEYINLPANIRYPPRLLGPQWIRLLEEESPKYTKKKTIWEPFTQSQFNRLYNLFNKEDINRDEVRAFCELAVEMLKIYATGIDIPDEQIAQLDGASFLMYLSINEKQLKDCKSRHEFATVLKRKMHYFISQQ